MRRRRDIARGLALGAEPGQGRRQPGPRAGRRWTCGGTPEPRRLREAGVWRCRHPTMLKRCGRRLLLALAGALLACLLVLTADLPPPPVPAERGRRAAVQPGGPSGAATAP